MPVPRSSLLRALVIRGDPTTVGVVLVLAAIGLVVAAGVGAVGWTIALPGAAAAGVAGLGLVRWSRAAYRALLAQVAAAHDDDDPGPSPVAWVSDAVWRARNRFDPTLDAPVLLAAELDPGLRGYGRDAGGAFTEPVVRPVVPEERELAAPAPIPEHAPVPDKATGEALAAAIADTPGRFIAVAPRWPVCCGRPATLEALTLDARPEGARVLPEVPGAPVDPAVDGRHAFQCRACGRRYATDPAW